VPTLDCSPPSLAGQSRSIELVRHGAILPVIIRSETGKQMTLSALVDIGSAYSGIDEALAIQLQLVVMRQEFAHVLNQQQIIVNIYRAEIEIPILGIREFTGLMGGLITGKQQALLGRSQLLNCDLSYAGPRGIANLSR
jgi:hypothetical protein